MQNDTIFTLVIELKNLKLTIILHFEPSMLRCEMINISLDRISKSDKNN